MKRSVLATVVLACALACGHEAPRAAGAFERLERLTQTSRTLRRAVAARPGAFAWDASTQKIMSQGWRATSEQRFDDLGVRLPARGDETVEIGISQFERLRVSFALVGARSAPAIVEEGRVLYPGVFPGVDRFFVSTATMAEELLLLETTHASRVFEWRVALPPGIVAVTRRGGGLSFDDALGRVVFSVAAPTSIDARGDALVTTLSWNDASHTMRIGVDASNAAFPVVVDPRYDAISWVRSPAFVSRSGTALAYDSARGATVMFGGSSETPLNDTWLWNGVVWTRATPTTSPPARNRHAMTFDSARGMTVMFGGSGAQPLDDTWEWDGATWRARLPVVAPAPRYFHGMAFDGVRRRTVLYGGSGLASLELSDTWEWDGTTWAQTMPAAKPSAKGQGMSLAFDSSAGRTLLFGGLDTANGRILNELWSYDGAAWQNITPAGASPSPRLRAQLAYDSGRRRLVLTGGGEFGTALNDTWEWDGARWLQQNPTAVAPPRTGGSAVYDAARQKVVLFGGETLGLAETDTWGWNGVAWSRLATPAVPGPRAAHVMVYDAARHESVLFGGQNRAGLNDTWLWNGAAWRQATPSVSPSARYASSIAYDTTRARTVLFGGFGDAALADTWEWNGTTWLSTNPGHRPPARMRGIMTYDPSRNATVLFGGYTLENHDPLGDTWTWDGTDWTQLSTVSSPAKRAEGGMTYDAVRGAIVLFGGTNNSGPLGDTWTLRGSVWQQETPLLSPTPRAPNMTFDPSRGDTLLYGGFGGSSFDQPFTDMWQWDGTRWSEIDLVGAPGVRNESWLVWDPDRRSGVIFGGYTLSLSNETWQYYSLGGSCTSNDQCPDTACVDGVCCEATRCGSCQTCAGITPGKCAPVRNAEDLDTCAARDGKTCSALGVCKAALGTLAASAADCASGIVADGVCCDAACDGPCQACAAGNKQSGTRSGVCDSARAGTDPRESCASEDPSSCGRDGTCDGRGACRLHGAGTACGAASCVDNRATGRLCDGLGACRDSAQGTACAPYACTAALGCFASCAGNESCAPLHHCDNGGCAVDRGAACDGDHSIVSANGARVDCGLYGCDAAVCRTHCARATECASGADCTVDGQCVAATPTRAPSDGCSSSRALPSSGACGGWLAAVVLAARCRRGRRGAACSRQGRRSIVK